tara:strand:- start:20556 stop:20975 length:420 start_codon:yes stop_codon:yes gene_type:complete
MKTFKNFITEMHKGSNYHDSAGLSSEEIPHDIDDVDVKNKINAILGHTAVSEYMNPEAAVEQMKAKLAQIGLNPSSAEAELEFSEAGEFDLNFSRYGEITGKSVDTPIDELDSEEKIVSLHVKYEQLENGCYKVYGSLV